MNLKPITLALLLAAATLQAHAVGRLADVTLVDRDTGARLPVYTHRGEYWVAGRPGARYAVSVRNALGERLLAVASVDGVNVISGETAAWEQTGYVFAARQGYQITGWRKSDQEVAAFEFADAGDAYATRTGRPGQLGVIGVALFRERVPEPVVVVPEPSRMREKRAAPAQESANESATASQKSTLADAAAPAAAPAPAAKLGTGHGARETSVVTTTEFERQQTRPDEIVRIRYDSYANLLASGVIARPPVRGPVPDPFPGSATASYVPDPPVRR
ncbi:hypothetical protein RD110_01615 [Rhodoferax koreense]|uniref:Uncharacterized protein n=1 Tax=Rhodoferax koreensis TaxID=1842727 RepID=A0A1P8JQN2_9BURK|nr:hypothetical protein [Rhodoferax koreense]APW36063.1 hypothetical protein RD110_01615 [Rhodoferax koreense]